MSNFGKIEKCILDIVWYIPIKKLRKSITNYLRTLIEYNEIIRKQNEIILKYTINKLPEKKIYELEESNFIKKYNEINSSYNKKCIFYIGSGAGFFSEFNLMVISILYCLCNKIEFKLYSQTANFSPKGLGWEEFFLPFCTQVYDPIHMLYNGRLYKTYVEIEKDFYKKYVNADFFTYDILDIAKTILKTNEDIHISDLEINGHIKELFGIIAKNIFRFNDKTKQEIKKLKSSLNLPEKYYGFHIRSGDKITEAKLINETKYMDIISNYSDNNITDIFVSTDNYSIFENLVKRLFSYKASREDNKDRLKELSLIKMLKNDSVSLYKEKLYYIENPDEKTFEFLNEVLNNKVKGYSEYILCTLLNQYFDYIKN